ncbi:DUF3090 domain-containing protein [soil metagenome]
MAVRDLGPAESFAAGAVGEPGNRRFYLQVTAGGVTVWLPAEKQQVAALGSQALTLLEAAQIHPDHSAVEALKSSLVITEPDQELFRIGGIQVAVMESELIALVVTSPDEDEAVRFVVAPEQLKAMAEVALGIVAAGRPVCPRCQLPEDPEGHRCPATNGHHPQ